MSKNKYHVELEPTNIMRRRREKRNFWLVEGIGSLRMAGTKRIKFQFITDKNFHRCLAAREANFMFKVSDESFFDEIKTLFLKWLKKLQNLIFKRRDEVKLVQFYNNYIELALNGFKALLKRVINCQFPAKHSWEARPTQETSRKDAKTASGLFSSSVL